MADIELTCPACGRAFKVSEYVKAEQVPCPACGVQVPKAKASEPTKKKKSSPVDEEIPKTHQIPAQRLSLKKGATSLVEADGDSSSHAKKVDEKSTTKKKKKRRKKKAEPKAVEGIGQGAMADVHKTTEKAKAPHSILGWLTFVILSVVLVGALYYMKEYPEIREYYKWARLIMIAVIPIFVLLVAFEDSTFQGIFCIILIPYMVYYTFVRSDSYILRGAMAALVVMLGAEMYFIPSDAFLTIAQNAMNNFIEGGNDLIQKASDEPVF